MRASDYRRLVDVAMDRKAQAARELASAEREVAETSAEAAAQAEAGRLIGAVTERVRRRAGGQVSSVVEMCLEGVFGRPFGFAIDFADRRGRTEADLVYTAGGEAVDPTTSSGGGVIDVTSFALRLASLVLSRPQPRRALILDEPFKHLSRQYRPAAAALLRALCGDMGVQIIMVTHDPVLAEAADRVVDIR